MEKDFSRFDKFTLPLKGTEENPPFGTPGLGNKRVLLSENPFTKNLFLE